MRHLRAGLVLGFLRLVAATALQHVVGVDDVDDVAGGGGGRGGRGGLDGLDGLVGLVGKGLRGSRHGFAALGDSYGAGIGTPIEGVEDACRRGQGAYPAVLARELPADETAFQWLACTGATTADVLGSAGGTAATQLDVLDAATATGGLDFVTLSLGGNDLGFFDVINACVFRFYGLYSGTCRDALDRADALVGEGGNDDTVFAQRFAVLLQQVLDRVRWERRPRFRIVVTGYAQFFNAETTACDACSMGVWRKNGNEESVHSTSSSLSSPSDSTLLTRTLRRRMNALVIRTNARLRASVAAANARLASPRILFVDYDAAFEGHRFCEPGVVEPDYARAATWFFLVGGNDTENSTTTSTPLFHSPLSPLVDPDRCLGPAETRGDWGERALCYMARAQAADRGLTPVTPTNSMWYVPTYYGKTFHPRSPGHRAIRDAIYRVWKENGV